MNFNEPNGKNLEKQFYDVYLDEKFRRICAHLMSRARSQTHTHTRTYSPIHAETGRIKPFKCVRHRKRLRHALQTKYEFKIAIHSFACFLQTFFLGLRQPTGGRIKDCRSERQHNARSIVRQSIRKRNLLLFLLHYFQFCCRARVLCARWADRHRISYLI